MVVLFQNLVLVYAGALILRTASGSERPPHARAVAVGVYGVALAVNFYHLFMFTHDHWIVLFWVCVFFDAADRLFGRAPSIAAMAGWGIAGGFSALTSPVLGPVWAALTVLLAIASKKTRPFATSAFVAAMVVGPWMVRNAIVFHRFVPVKSNLAFELYQSQCLEPDGVLRQATAVSHPYLSDGAERQLYRKEGETNYLEEKQRLFLDSIRKAPVSYLNRIGNRLVAATVLYVPYDTRDSRTSKFLGTVLHPVPFIGLVLTLTTPGWARDRRKMAAIAIYSLIILPYIIISYYIRYAMPLLAVKVLFCLWAWESLYRIKTPPGWPSGGSLLWKPGRIRGG